MSAPMLLDFAMDFRNSEFELENLQQISLENKFKSLQVRLQMLTIEMTEDEKKNFQKWLQTKDGEKYFQVSSQKCKIERTKNNVKLRLTS